MKFTNGFNSRIDLDERNNKRILFCLPKHRHSVLFGEIDMRNRLLVFLTLIGAALLSTPCRAQLSALHASGTKIVNASGTTVQLAGTNLGGWFIMEPYMMPIDTGGTYNTDEYTMMIELSNRFGPTVERNLVLTYEQNFITTADITNIQAAGLNLVRIPIWWGSFFSLSAPSQSTYRTNEFAVLDNIINACAAHGIYVVLDLHGAVGSQSGNPDTGQANAGGSSTGLYFSNTGYQSLTAWLWGQIATHYSSANFANSSAIAGFDLLNEATGGTQAQLLTQYGSIYTAVRNADPNRMIILETIDSANWSFSAFPSPASQGWTNVVYSTHTYACPSTPSTCTSAQVNSSVTATINDYNSIKTSYSVPAYVGEYTAYTTGPTEWQSVQTSFANAGLAYSAWNYKADTTPSFCFWGWYCPTGTRPPAPNIGTDSSATISSDWSAWTTTPDFIQNSNIHM